jgi:hypothetical protein
MHDFALVSEGPTDHAVLRNILIGYFKEQREPAIHREHPDPQAEAAYGGWTLLLHYLREKKFRQAFQLNKFLIVQVDTDITQEHGFDVPHHDDQGQVSTAELVHRVIQRLRKEIGEPDWEAYAGRFIFAIAVDEIECWVLPLWFDGAHAAKVTGCLKALGACEPLREQLKQQRFRWIRPEEKDARSYDLASRGYRKPKALHEKGRLNPSLAHFFGGHGPPFARVAAGRLAVRALDGRRERTRSR